MKTKLELYTNKAAFIEDLLELEELPTVVQVLLNEYKDILRNDSRNTPRETTRESILDGAKECVLTDRNNLYGAPEDSFRVIADLWTCYLRGRGHTITVTADDAATMLVLLKIARASTAKTPKEDTYIDIAGYAACAGEIACRGDNHE